MKHEELFFLILIVALVSPITKSSFPENSLHDLIRGGNGALAKVMINQGADLEARTDYCQTPLHCAVRADKASIVQHLLEQGADIESTDEGGNTSVMCAVAFDRSIDIKVLELLLQAGSDINARNKKGESAIDLLLLAKRDASLNNDTTIEHDERSIAENRVRPFKIRRLLERGAQLTREQFESLFLPHQKIVYKRMRRVEDALKEMTKEDVPKDLEKEILSMLYGDRKYSYQLKQWCESAGFVVVEKN